MNFSTRILVVDDMPTMRSILQGMLGIDLLRVIRSSPHIRDLPFLMVTHQGDPSQITEATRLGIADYIVKPFSAQQLGETIQCILRV